MQYDAISYNNGVHDFGSTVWADYFTLVAYLATSFSIKRGFGAEDRDALTLSCLACSFSFMINYSFYDGVCAMRFIPDKPCFVAFGDKFFHPCGHGCQRTALPGFFGKGALVFHGPGKTWFINGATLFKRNIPDDIH